MWYFVDSSIPERLTSCQKFVAHTLETEGEKTKKCACTAVSGNILMTYAHGKHRRGFKAGQEVEVRPCG